ncbi:hypothetical protein FHS00_000007 [Limimaricola variabilis]|uniref:Uncharacterized protein n=1 Tax=Limimaricola variabilis TaxID=1492771 RepID=A0ABR6HIT3_9RHOB|nr:hypothetical protein [Limimaricola variabilis]MBB3710454.1 hypothetical protein [Limimaricola variabilis]
MKTLHLHEFERHLEKAHLNTQYAYMPNSDRVPPDLAWGWITNELITRGASFQAIATFCHPRGLPALANIRPFSSRKACLDHVGFHLLDETGADADMDEVCARVVTLRPELMVFDAAFVEAVTDRWVRIDRRDHRTYCLQAVRRPDLVFDGSILEWDYILDEEAENSIWTERTKYRTAHGGFVALREQTTFEGQERVLSDREFQIFSTEEEADDFLYREERTNSSSRRRRR